MFIYVKFVNANSFNFCLFNFKQSLTVNTCTLCLFKIAVNCFIQYFIDFISVTSSYKADEGWKFEINTSLSGIWIKTNSAGVFSLS